MGISASAKGIIIKLQFDDDLNCKEDIIATRGFNEHLFRCHTLPDGHILAFHFEQHHTVHYNENLECLNKFCWTEVLGIPFGNISLTCINASFRGSDETTIICGFSINPR